MARNKEGGNFKAKEKWTAKTRSSGRHEQQQQQQQQQQQRQQQQQQQPAAGNKRPPRAPEKLVGWESIEQEPLSESSASPDSSPDSSSSADSKQSKISGESKINFFILDLEVPIPQTVTPSEIPSPQSGSETFFPMPTAFYHGRIQYEHESKSRKASFLSFENKETADRIFNCGEITNLFGVLKPSFRTYSGRIEKHIVCFTKFDGLLHCRIKYLQWLNKAVNPRRSLKNPRRRVQNFIKKLIAILREMHRAGVSCSLLGSLSAYFWCDGEVKLLATSCREECETEAEWEAVKKCDLLEFKKGIKALCFQSTEPDDDRKMEGSFFDAFSVPIRSESDRLDMLYDHPYLDFYIKHIYKIFSDVDHALQDGVFDRPGMKELCHAINSGAFNEYVLDKESGSWYREKMKYSFQKVFKDRDVKYETGRVPSFFRFIRNIYEHHYNKNYTNFYRMVAEIEKQWPLVTHRLHEYLYKY